ncbi:MAG: tetratricopeptide (TPR) repeat protein [Myxococcota bacterium]|jgi:tetratricopeptide (TPR) repeat protein
MNSPSDIPSLKAWRANQSRLVVALLGPARNVASRLQFSDRRCRLLHLPDTAAALSLTRAPDVVLYPMGLGEDELLAIHQHLSREGTTFLVAGSIRYASPEVCRIATAVIDWPIRPVELTAVLQRIMTTDPRTSPKLSRENVRRLALLCSRKETGLMRYRGITEVQDGELTLHAGGLDPACWAVLYPLLHTGTIRFKRSRSLPAADTDRSWLGRLLMNAVWKQDTGSFALQCGDGQLRADQPAADLSSSALTCRLLNAADGVTTITALLNRLSLDGATVGEDLYALQALRLLEWQSLPARLNRSSSTRRRRRGETSQNTRTVSRSLYSQTSVSGVPRPRRLARPEQVRGWLEKTQADLQRATPEDTLGISNGVSSEMLQIAEDRLVKRYDDILASSHVPDDITELALDLRQLTQEAARAIRQRGRGGPPVTGRDYRSGQQNPQGAELLARGNKLIGAEDWAQADHLLSEALRLSATHPGVLSALAWARYNNAGLNKPDREGQARDLLRRAIEQDPRFAEAHYYLANIHHTAGNAIAARAAARRASRMDPDDARYAKLLTKV